MTNNEIINKKDYKYDFSESNDKKNENWRKNEKDLKSWIVFIWTKY